MHYLVAQTFATEIETEKSHLARTVGCAYAFGILLQFINNNCISSVAVQVIFLCLAFAVMEGLFMVKAQQVGAQGETHPLIEADGVARKTGMLLIFIVALMTFIFATLDNAVTLVHAGGGADIGQWPRLLLACSGLLAGFLYDIKKGAYQNIIMYCVMMLSTICVVVITCGGPFILGLVVFYLSAGFFSIYFASSYASFVCNVRGKTMGWTGACCQQSVCGGNGFNVTGTFTFAKLCYHCHCTCVICYYKCSDFCIPEIWGSNAMETGKCNFITGSRKNRKDIRNT